MLFNPPVSYFPTGSEMSVFDQSRTTEGARISLETEPTVVFHRYDEVLGDNTWRDAEDPEWYKPGKPSPHTQDFW